MIGFPSNLRILVALDPCDMRKSFKGLVIIADALKEQGLQSGTLFIFTNKRRKRLKVLYYDRTGICILVKRSRDRDLLLASPVQWKKGLALAESGSPPAASRWNRPALLYHAPVV
jgi:transposase